MEEELFYGNLSFSLKKISDEMPADLNSIYNKFTDSIYIFPNLYKSANEIDYLINNLNTSLPENHTYILMDIKLKEYWNRARPYQYANLIEAPLYPMTTMSGHSPAYPSGHTLQGLIWAKLVSTVKPDLKGWADSISIKINLSRLALGVHFPSDIEFSKKIYEDLVSNKFI